MSEGPRGLESGARIFKMFEHVRKEERVEGFPFRSQKLESRYGFLLDHAVQTSPRPAGRLRFSLDAHGRQSGPAGLRGRRCPPRPATHVEKPAGTERQPEFELRPLSLGGVIEAHRRESRVEVLGRARIE